MKEKLQHIIQRVADRIEEQRENINAACKELKKTWRQHLL